MAIVTYGPMISDARGSVAGTTFSRWKQTSYTRRKTRPANPNTTDQQAVRNVFRTLNNLWKFMPTITRQAWTKQAAGRNYANRNHFIGVNVPLLLGQANCNDMILAPGEAGTAPVTTFTVTPGNDQLTLAATMPVVPQGTTLNAMVFAIFKDGDPEAPWSAAIQEASDVSDPYSVVFSGLESAVTYQCFAWPALLGFPEGERYGISTNLQGLTT